MINEAVVLMTILGCDNEIKVCDFVSETQPRWETTSECENEIPVVLGAIRDAPYPVLTAKFETDPVALLAASVPELKEQSVVPDVGPENRSGIHKLLDISGPAEPIVQSVLSAGIFVRNGLSDLAARVFQRGD